MQRYVDFIMTKRGKPASVRLSAWTGSWVDENQPKALSESSSAPQAGSLRVVGKRKLVHFHSCISFSPSRVEYRQAVPHCPPKALALLRHSLLVIARQHILAMERLDKLVFIRRGTGANGDTE